METRIQRQSSGNMFFPIVRQSENLSVTPTLTPSVTPKVVTIPQKEVRNLPFIEANTKEDSMPVLSQEHSPERLLIPEGSLQVHPFGFMTLPLSYMVNPASKVCEIIPRMSERP